MHKAHSPMDRAWQAAEEGRPLPSDLRARFEHALGADLSAVRVHTGPEADAAARAHGADAVASGSGLFFRDGAYRPGDPAGLRLLAHEVAHTVQQAGSADAVVDRGPGGTAHWELEADRFADAFIASGTFTTGAFDTGTFSPGHRVGVAGRPIRIAAGPSPAAVVQRHASFEHRAIGDLEPEILYQIVDDGGMRAPTLQRQIKLMELFKDGDPRKVTAAQMKAVDPSLEILTIGPDQIVATLGEINALPDYFANPETIDQTPAEPLLNILQLIRQDTYNKFKTFLESRKSDVQFPLSPYKPTGWGAIDSLIETSALDQLLAGMGEAGRDHYSGLLARNACHFAPYSWHRWGFFNALARKSAKEFYDTKKPEKRAEALRLAGYADHFLEDSFAAGHLIDKTLVMQWFVQWAKQRDMVTDSAILQYMTAVLQPGLQAGKLYDPDYTGPSHDPQTVQEMKTMALRVSGTRLRPGREQARFRAYLDYLTFVTSGVAQIATAELHDHYNANSLWVASPATPQAFKIYGDDTFFAHEDGGVGVLRTAGAAKMSRNAVYDILKDGVTGISPAAVRAHFPTMAGSDAKGLKPLQQWVADQQGWVEENIFANRWDEIVDYALRLVSPRTGVVSQDQQLAAKWYSPMGESILDQPVDVLPGQADRFYATSNGWLYELDARTGQRIPNRRIQIADLSAFNDQTGMLAMDDTNVYVGVAGYVHAVARKGDWTRIAWTTPKNLGGRDKIPRPVTLRIVKDRLYAGCHGYVYELDRATGAIKQTAELGDDAIDAGYPVDFATDGATLFAGTHGYAYGLSLTEPWSKFANGYMWASGHLDNLLAYQPVALLSADKRLWAASNGWVYELSPHDGKIMKESQFDPSAGLLSRYAHMAFDGGRLYLGSHGRAYAFAVDGPWEKKSGELWRSDRLSALIDHAPATMLYFDDRLFAACDGSMYELDLFDGRIIETWLLTTVLAEGLDFTMTLAVSGGDGFAGLHGYAYGLLLNGLDAAPTAAWPLTPPSDGVSVPDQRDIHPATASPGVTWQKSPAIGGYARFNGTNSQVETARGVVDTTPGRSFTVSAWVRLDPLFGNSDQAVLSQAGDVASGFVLGYSVQEQTWFFRRARYDSTQPQWRRLSARTPAVNNLWTHVAAVYDAEAVTAAGEKFTEMRIYVNGVRRGAEAVTDPAVGFNARGPFQIGVARVDGQPAQRLKGDVRDVRVYNRALDDLLLEPRGAAFWRLDDGSGDVARDVLNAHRAAAKAIGWQWVEGVGYVADFDGTDSRVSTSAAVVDTGAKGSFTVAGWVRVTADGVGTLLGQDGEHCSAFHLTHTTVKRGTARWVFTREETDSVGSRSAAVSTGKDVPNGEWAHLVGVYDASVPSMTVYLNGERCGVELYQGKEWVSEKPFTIGYGKFNNVHGNVLKGSARDVRAFNQALSEQQIKDLLYVDRSAGEGAGES